MCTAFRLFYDTNLENHRRQLIAKNGLKPPIFRSVVDVIFGDSYELIISGGLGYNSQLRGLKLQQRNMP